MEKKVSQHIAECDPKCEFLSCVKDLEEHIEFLEESERMVEEENFNQVKGLQDEIFELQTQLEDQRLEGGARIAALEAEIAYWKAVVDDMRVDK
jgi:hypothetical protein